MTSKSSNVSFFGLLTIVFIVLKLLNKIDWSWFWVLSPLFLPVTIIIIGVLIWAVVKGVFKTIKQRNGIKIFEKIKDNKLDNNLSEKYKSKWQERYSQVLESQKKIENLKKGKYDEGLENFNINNPKK